MSLFLFLIFFPHRWDEEVIDLVQQWESQETGMPFQFFPQSLSILQSYTGWPRKNATTLIINFKNIVNKTDLFSILPGRKFIFQQNDTMTSNFG